jgi:DNA-binding HxlR family transcriptional regulator
MSGYGQFCPIAKALGVLGERWTLLLVRELLQGSRRFSDLQRGLARMSPSLLTKRLKELEAAGLVVRVRSAGQKGFEYELTQAGRDLNPVVMELARWGLTWVRSTMARDELDLDLLMLDIQRGMKRELLPAGKVVIEIRFTDQKRHARWWLVLDKRDVDVCSVDPGVDVDIYLSGATEDFVRYWMGDIDWGTATRQRRIAMRGNAGLLRELPKWLGRSAVAQMNPRFAG